MLPEVHEMDQQRGQKPDHSRPNVLTTADTGTYLVGLRKDPGEPEDECAAASCSVPAPCRPKREEKRGLKKPHRLEAT
jgi:hypothetical protein